MYGRLGRGPGSKRVKIDGAERKQPVNRGTACSRPTAKPTGSCRLRRSAGENIRAKLTMPFLALHSSVVQNERLSQSERYWDRDRSARMLHTRPQVMTHGVRIPGSSGGDGTESAGGTASGNGWHASCCVGCAKTCAGASGWIGPCRLYDVISLTVCSCCVRKAMGLHD
jgi:hypothetical protein